MTSQSLDEQTNLSAPRLTGEVALYGLIALAALALRLANLTRYPLNDAEASQALAGLAIYMGGIPAEGYSPLIASLTAFSFVLFGAADWAARLIPALFGVALVLLPFGLRKQLGVVGALIASILLAFSPTAIFWSRTVSGDTAVAVGLLLLLIGGVRFFSQMQSSGLNLAAVALALLVLSAPAGFTALVVTLFLVGIVLIFNPEAQHLLQKGPEQNRAGLRQAGLIFVGLIPVFATAATFNLTGLAAVSEMFNRWLGQFGFQAQPGAGLSAVLQVLIYEPLILLFGFIGAAWAVYRRQSFALLIVAWLSVAALIDMLMGGRSNGQVMLVVLPLALLAGKQLGALWGQWQTGIRLDGEGLLVGISLMVSTFIYISLTSWSKCTEAQVGCNSAWILPLAGIFLLAGLTIIFAMWYGPQLAWRGIGLVLVITATCLSLGFAWRLNFGPLGHLPFQPMISLPPSAEFPLLLTELERISVEKTGEPHTLSPTVVNLDVPMLRWYLRDFEQTIYVPNFMDAEGKPVILARPDMGNPVSGAYMGQDFSLISHWQMALLEGKTIVRWYLFRHVPTHIPGTDQVVLWAAQ